MKDPKDDRAGLIHQPIPDMEGTEPRPNIQDLERWRDVADECQDLYEFHQGIGEPPTTLKDTDTALALCNAAQAMTEMLFKLTDGDPETSTGMSVDVETDTEPFDPANSKLPYRLIPNDPRTPIYDDYGRWVADCRDKDIARLIVALLNTQKGKP